MLDVMTRLASLLRLIVLVTFEVATVVSLHQLGDLPWLQLPGGAVAWRAAPVDDVLAAVVRLAALVCAWWLLGSTVVYLVARLTRVPAAIRGASLLTPAAVRRATDRAVAVALVGTTMLGGAAPALARLELPAAVALSESGPPPLVPPAAPGAVSEVPAPLLAGEPALRPEVLVAPGDNLWRLAATWLAVASGRQVGDVPDAEVIGYWRDVVAHNTPRLRSGDPDLIYPGERVVVLPPPAVAPPPAPSVPASPDGAAATPAPAASPAPTAPPPVSVPPAAAPETSVPPLGPPWLPVPPSLSGGG